MSKTTGNYSTGVTRRNSGKGLIGMNFLMMREKNLVNQVGLKQSPYTHQTDIGMVNQKMVFQMDKELPMYLVVQHLLEHIKKVKDMKEHLLFPMEKYISESGKIINDGMQ